MRKVLLATTALVALNVSAATADVSISGAGQFTITDTTEGQTFASDGDITIKGTNTTDSGLTLTASHNMLFEGASGDTNHVDDSYIDISGDFGSIRMGQTDNALDLNDGALPENMDVKTIGATGVTTGAADTLGISYTSPSFNGIKVYATAEADGDTSGFGANYTAGPVEVMFQSDDNGTATETTAAAKFSAGAVTVQIGAANRDGSTKYAFRQIGASYTMGDIKLVAVQLKEDESAKKYSNFGATYTVAPGFTIAAETATQSDTSETSSWLGFTVSF
jgi:hypothetical protein